MVPVTVNVMETVVAAFFGIWAEVAMLVTVGVAVPTVRGYAVAALAFTRTTTFPAVIGVALAILQLIAVVVTAVTVHATFVLPTVTSTCPGLTPKLVPVMVKNAWAPRLPTITACAVLPPSAVATATCVTVGVKTPTVMARFAAACALTVTLTLPAMMVVPACTLHWISVAPALIAVTAQGCVPPVIGTVTTTWPGLVPKLVPVIVSASAFAREPAGMGAVAGVAVATFATVAAPAPVPTTRRLKAVPASVFTVTVTATVAEFPPLTVPAPAASVNVTVVPLLVTAMFVTPVAPGVTAPMPPKATDTWPAFNPKAVPVIVIVYVVLPAKAPLGSGLPVGVLLTATLVTVGVVLAPIVSG